MTAARVPVSAGDADNVPHGSGAVCQRHGIERIARWHWCVFWDDLVSRHFFGESVLIWHRNSIPITLHSHMGDT